MNLTPQPPLRKARGGDLTNLLTPLPEFGEGQGVGSQRGDIMSDECAELLPPEAEEAIRLFNAGEFYKQHDLFETLWRDEPRPIRNLYQGILQIGVGYFQITRGNMRGGVKMIQRGQRWLALLPDHCRGVDVAALKADAAHVEQEVKRVGIDQFDKSLFQPVKRVQS